MVAPSNSENRSWDKKYDLAEIVLPYFVFFPHWGVEITVNCQSRLFDKNFAKTIFSKAMELYIWRNGKISVIIMFRFVFLLHNSLESRGDYAMQKIFENLKYYENLNSFT